ncbi:hypothetical protein SAMN04489761_2235 [Tenacibaculum sp. MAR_2009_124]|uniref:hypothetical protein n=1 Tax=Tenacibaculum sp. MAR_2009_124 TaxID=1250059 RepID=UPI000898FAD3|nr:hypothetical protein [Tenacibaculum sp. MAR_2009_124]SEC00789.1 hypothetical protein SAMN04489761_2235 [Tenacibaculum sp. MAR_2009_124]
MQIKKITYPSPSEPYSKELLSEISKGVKTTLGTVFLKKGTRIPDKGFSKHPFNEVSIITKGCIEMLNEDESIKGCLRTGSAVYINALEAQAGNVLEDTTLIYILNENTNHKI